MKIPFKSHNRERMIIIKLKWLGNSSLQIKGEKNIIIDPNYFVEPDFKADIVLITHEHDDHIDLDKLDEISNDATEVYAPVSVFDKFDFDGEIVESGQVIEDEIKVIDIDCYQAESSVAYFYKGVYHTGDASVYPDPGKEIEALFTACFQDHYSSYIECCIKLDPNLAIPFHYDPEERQDLLNAKGLSSKLEQIGCESEVLKPGEELEI